MVFDFTREVVEFMEPTDGLALDRAVSELAEALRDSDDVKKQGNECAKENKDLRERLDGLEKEIRIRKVNPSVRGRIQYNSRLI